LFKKFKSALGTPNKLEITETPEEGVISICNRYINELEDTLVNIDTNVLLGLILNTQVNDIINTSVQMVESAEKDMAAGNTLRTFVDYYFPMTIKLVKAYTDNCGKPYENSAVIIEKVHGVMDTIVDAFHKQLDAMYEAKKLDIKTDIAVLKQVLQSEGLK
jgi:hypothetical protein